MTIEQVNGYLAAVLDLEREGLRGRMHVARAAQAPASDYRRAWRDLSAPLNGS